MLGSHPMLVLAGGFGTRLRSVCNDRPKPLVEVNGQPFLHYLLTQWYAAGHRDLVFLLHFDAAKLVNYLTSPAVVAAMPELRIRWVVEQTPLGTGGAIKYGLDQLTINGRFWVGNADTWCLPDWHLMQGSDDAAMAMTYLIDTDRFGRLTLQDKQITGFAEKQVGAGAGWINAGFYWLDSAMFSDAPPQAFAIEQTILPALANEQRLTGVPCLSEMIDIGVPDDYYRFCDQITQTI